MRICQWFLLSILCLFGCTQDPKRATIVDGGANIYLPAIGITEEGDSWHTLAARYKIRAEDLAQYNHSPLIEPPYPGKKIYIPHYVLHRVKPKEYLAMIARYYGSSLEDIKRRNKLESDTIKVKQVLEVPVKRSNKSKYNNFSRPLAPVVEEIHNKYPPTTTSAKEVSETPTSNTKVQNDYPKTPEPQSFKSTGSSKFSWPLRGKIIHGFGNSTHKGITYEGISIAAPLGTPIRAAAKGTVAYTGNKISGYGTLTIIKHDDNWFSAYGHQQEVMVKLGQHVSRGEVIGTVGNSGKASVTQLYFSLRKGEQPIDPLGYLGK